MSYREKKLRKSSSYKSSSRKIPKSNAYQINKYGDEDYKEEEENIDLNAAESNSGSFPDSPNTQYSLNLSPNPLVQPKLHKFVNIAPFPIFKATNEECPFSHLSRFIKVCRANNVSSIPTMMRIFPITLENEAALWFDLNVEPYHSLSWEEIVSSFLEAYQKTNFESEITSTKRGENESVRSYFLRLQWVLKIYPDHGLKDEMVTRVFVDGLNGEFRDWVASKEPDSLDDALRLAFDWEKAKGLRKGGEVCEVMGKLRGMELNEIKETKKVGCQCSKHQCGNKRFERSDSTMSVKSKNLLL